ncbi:MAG: SEC-C metal-binding domain-containing protein [Actinomycetota bacterium]|nr:SEC-C metal-binding domain-containing protein [Actinomycetota bacterium]
MLRLSGCRRRPGRGLRSRLVKIGRNDPCPCGSGAKVKRCCGVDGVRRSQDALKDLFSLAFHFPRQRPASGTFDARAEHARDQLTRELLEEGLVQLGAAEQARIPAEFAAAYPQVWETILDEVGGHDAVLQVLLIGAVVAGLEERQRQVDPAALELLEVDEEARNDPVESLALVLVPTDLWSAFEVIDATESLDTGGTTAVIAEQLWSGWHEQRLEDLVHRLRERLPVAGFPAASSAIESGCRAFERDPWVRARLRSELLLDALPTVADALDLVA